MSALFLDVLHKTSSRHPPIWFMRQAGRYLPEYMEIRQKYTSFLELCYSPKDATRITLQPIERFDLDAAILFSDILVIPDSLGQDVSFLKSEGPVLSPLSLKDYEKSLSTHKCSEKLRPVYETVHEIKGKLPPTKGLIGFSGAPWTLALYMLEGRGSRDFAKAKRESFENEELFSNFLDLLADCVADHLLEQVQAGADAIQLFDSWAGLCPETHFLRWVIAPTQKIVAVLRDKYPDLPIIGFPRNAGAQYVSYGKATGVTALSLDASTPLCWAKNAIPEALVLQGNLDPVSLVAGGEPLKEAIRKIKEEMDGKAYIFNLGHGILPQTPVSHVQDCVDWVREAK